METLINKEDLVLELLELNERYSNFTELESIIEMVKQFPTEEINNRTNTTPITKLIQDRIEMLEKSESDYDEERYYELQILLPQIQELESNSIESLLEEMENCEVWIVSNFWPYSEQKYFAHKREYNEWGEEMWTVFTYWKTPQEALLKLRDKLNSN